MRILWLSANKIDLAYNVITSSQNTFLIGMARKPDQYLKTEDIH